MPARAAHTARSKTRPRGANATGFSLGVILELIDTVAERAPSLVDAANWVYAKATPVWP